VKIHDFGLWFRYWDGVWCWSTSIPPPLLYIFYDGVYLGCQFSNFELHVVYDKLYIIKLKNKLWVTKSESRRKCFYRIGRLLTLDDFEIVSNPDYKGVV
jgi:hypothetical protein